MWLNEYQIQEAATPAEMRAEMFRLQFHDPLVRSIMDAASYTGMSAEDRYTVLAYSALVQRKRLLDIALDGVMKKPLVLILFTRKTV